MRILEEVMPPIVLRVGRALRRRLVKPQVGQGHSPEIFDAQEHRAIVARMDAGDFDFDPALEERLCAAWRKDPASVPYPTALTEAYGIGDAIAMNDQSLMELSYRLPYSHAYETTQREKYEAFLRATARAGVDFSGDVAITDVGCGYGGLLAVAHEMHPAARLCGVECAASAIEFMEHRRPYIRGVVADVQATNEAFVGAVGGDHDIVLCTEVLEHLLSPEQALANLLALQPSRGIALTVPQGRIDTAAQHINFWSPESWRAFIVRHAGNRRAICGFCESAGSPGKADNFAVLLPN